MFLSRRRFVGGMGVVLVVLTLGLKNRQDELQRVSQLKLAGTQGAK